MVNDIVAKVAALGAMVIVICKIVDYAAPRIMDYFFPIKTYLELHNETNTKLQAIFIASIGKTHNKPYIDTSPKAQTTIEFIIKRVDDNCILEVTLSFDNGLVDIFIVNQAFAANTAESFEFKHTNCSHEISYKKEGNNTMKVTIAHTPEQLDNNLAEELLKEALSKSQQKRFKEAFSKLEEAQKKASSSTIKEKIRNGLAHVLISQGLDEESQGFHLENGDMPDDAASNFNNAKTCFQRVQEYLASTVQSMHLERVNCKIDGNNLINEGNDLIEEAMLLNHNAECLKDKNFYAKALNNFDLALDKCKRAEELFRKGATNCNYNRFEASLDFVGETIEEINQIKMEINLKQCNTKRTQQNTTFKRGTKTNVYQRQIQL